MSWAEREIVRIHLLSDQLLLAEIHNAMNGYDYSWKMIHRRLRELEVDYKLFREWIELCDIRQAWEKHPSLCKSLDPFDHAVVLAHLSAGDSRALMYRSLLVRLRTVPLKALGAEGIKLVTTNMDGSHGIDLGDLWVDCQKWKMGYVDRQWIEDNVADEEAPLLGRVATRSRWWTWPWAKMR